MFIAGIMCSFAGTGMLIALINGVEKARGSILYSIDEGRATVFMAISVILILAGIILTILGVIKSRNRATYNSMMNMEKNILQKTKCPKCGINLSASASACPKCSEIIIREAK